MMGLRMILTAYAVSAALAQRYGSRGMIPCNQILLIVLFRSVREYVTFQFLPSIADGPEQPAPFFEIEQNVTSFTCLNLDEVFNKQETTQLNLTSGNTTLDSPLFVLNGVPYTRPAEWNGGTSSGSNFNASATYDSWYIRQGPYGGSGAAQFDYDTGIPATMLLKVYGEADCRNATHPWIGYSCRKGFAVPGSPPEGEDWGAKSVSLQPNDGGGPGCLYNAVNGVEMSGARGLAETLRRGRGVLALWATAAAFIALI